MSYEPPEPIVQRPDRPPLFEQHYWGVLIRMPDDNPDRLFTEHEDHLAAYDCPAIDSKNWAEETAAMLRLNGVDAAAVKFDVTVRELAGTGM